MLYSRRTKNDAPITKQWNKRLHQYLLVWKFQRYYARTGGIFSNPLELVSGEIDLFTRVGGISLRLLKSITVKKRECNEECVGKNPIVGINRYGSWWKYSNTCRNSLRTYCARYREYFKISLAPLHESRLSWLVKFWKRILFARYLSSTYFVQIIRVFKRSITRRIVKPRCSYRFVTMSIKFQNILYVGVRILSRATAYREFRASSLPPIAILAINSFLLFTHYSNYTDTFAPSIDTS